MSFVFEVKTFLILLFPLFSCSCRVPINDKQIFIKEPRFTLNLSSNPNDIQFLYFPDTRYINYSKEISYGDAMSITDSGFVIGKNTVFITHGFRSDSNGGMPQTLKNAFLNAKANSLPDLDYNVIILNWGNLASPSPPELALTSFPFVALNVPVVGQRLGEFLTFLIGQNALPLSSVYLIGHGLGAHASGIAGRYILASTGYKVPRITGLDPAGGHIIPGERHLLKSDASFVDVIHTNAGVMGDLNRDGHADFYPNGGRNQPGCHGEDIQSTDNLGQCSHDFSYKLYAASLTTVYNACPCEHALASGAFGSCQVLCDNPLPVGYYCPNIANGEFYLRTDIQLPN